jgi:DNA repair exonuclease SbcCD ATPase subunit
MIRIESITIEEFRGVRKLTLDFKGKNFSICGPNGTGKRGVVDALEFVLTGNISRLSGEGRGEISLRQQAPDVDTQVNLGNTLAISAYEARLQGADGINFMKESVEAFSAALEVYTSLDFPELNREVSDQLAQAKQDLNQIQK